MPKRIIDGNAIWHSQKIRQRISEMNRLHYTFLVPLATANGTFECDPFLVHATCYAFLLPTFSIEDVGKILDEFWSAGLLFRWFEPDGKFWGFWVGIDKPGRLPGAKRIDFKHEKVGPHVPKDLLDEYVANIDGYQRSTNGQPLASLGFGFGFGSGLRFGLRSGLETTENVVPKLPEIPTRKPTEKETPNPSPQISLVGEEEPNTRAVTDALTKEFKDIYGQPPTWAKADYVLFAELFRRRKDLTLTDYVARYQHMLESQVPFHRQQAGSLKFFCTNFDQFIQAVPPINGNGRQPSGKPDANRTQRNLEAAGLAHPKVARPPG